MKTSAVLVISLRLGWLVRQRLCSGAAPLHSHWGLAATMGDVGSQAEALQPLRFAKLLSGHFWGCTGMRL